VVDPNKIFRQKALEKLQSPDRLDELLTVTAPSAWIVLAVLVTLLTALAGWAIGGSVQLRAEGEGVLVARPGNGGLEAVLYVSLADAPRIRPGMPAFISPLSAPQAQHGLLRGTVSGVEGGPSTSAEMLRNGENDALIQTWIAQGNLVEVRVQLVADPARPGDYAWTLDNRGQVPLRDRTPMVGSVTVSEQRPFTLLLP
jgi:HlyD family secretion protein